MSLVNCKKMRYFVITAFVLFVLGLFLQLPRVLSDEISNFTTLLSGLGLLAILLSPMVIISITLVSLFPNASRFFHLCNH